MSSPYTVILPAFNEERAIVATLEAIRKHNPQAEVLVVDDGSTDKTADLAAGAGATVVRHPANAGYGKSIMDGILQAKHDIIVLTDADGSYPVERIPELAKKIEDGFDMYVGARSGTHYRGTFLKMPARIVFKFLVEFVTGRHIPDINSGLRAFRKATAVPYFPDLCQGFSFTTTITLIYMLTGKFVGYLPIEYHKRIGRSKVRMVRDTLRTLQYIVEVVVAYNPLKLFVLLSSTLGAAAVLAAIAAAVWTSGMWLQVSAIFLVGAFLMFGIGLQTEAQRN